ncbi:hypothetical protein PAXINDRAFT_11520 [Paxillus involutus ATCC 200175]|uniref:Cation efflux protein transmembrane domain-containing protein n=1 Tax=Paxillus involutus ATCC 200175 TaxID=664439 RepID=A0A0C9UAH3_PAXIN|nr:hypothetical protein PAXINDRAFT_11520 [Paxillus involutus ATCC 200175]
MSRYRLQQYAIGISIFSVFYNAAEGVVSVVFGVDSSSHSLVFFGIQSVIEVISSVLVTWRFLSAVKHGDEDGASNTNSRIIRVERIATTGIGLLLIMLAFAAMGTSIASLVVHDHPSTSTPSLIIAASTSFINILLWVAKRYLARALDSSTMNGEALCALSCLQFGGVLLVGSLIYHVWHGGWWADSVTAIVIGLLFGWEGFKMVRWARHEDFDGGCCTDCRPRNCTDNVVTPQNATAAGIKEQVPAGSPCTDTGCHGCSKEEHAVVEHV